MNAPALLAPFSAAELPQVLAVLDRVAVPAPTPALPLADRLVAVCAQQGLTVTPTQVRAILAELQDPPALSERAQIEQAWHRAGSLLVDRAHALVADHIDLTPVDPRRWLVHLDQRQIEAPLRGETVLKWEGRRVKGVRKVEFKAGQTRTEQRVSQALAVGLEANFLDRAEGPADGALWSFAYALLVPASALRRWCDRPWWRGGRRRQMTPFDRAVLASRFDVPENVIQGAWNHLMG